MSIALFKEMFEQMVVRKDAGAAGRYYHPDFVMYSDGLRQDFAEFAASRDGLIHRIWETTWPSWRSLDAFENY